MSSVWHRPQCNIGPEISPVTIGTIDDSRKRPRSPGLASSIRRRRANNEMNAHRMLGAITAAVVVVAAVASSVTHTMLASDIRRKQPIMRIEDRLFDRGWVRSAMATKKCGNICFPKYFMAVRPFLTRKRCQELFGLEGSNKFLEKNRQVHNLKISNRLLRSKSFFQKIFLVLYAAYVYPFWVVSL